MTPVDAETACAEAEKLLHGGSPLGAYDVVADALRLNPGHVRLRQLLALSLTRSGAGVLAQPILKQLLDEGHVDEESLGLLARIHKDLAAQSTGVRARRHLRLAHLYYVAAFERSGGIWSGINAATTALLLDDRETAIGLACAVRDRTVADVQHGGVSDEYWRHATLGECHLILSENQAAEEEYVRAATLGRGRPADIVATRRNARQIVRHLDIDDSAIERALHVARVAAFAGHMIDRPDRPQPRFPPALEPAVARAIRDRLDALDIGFGYSSAACGADILFIEALRARRGESTLVLPYNSAQFAIDSVGFVPQGGWTDRFEAALHYAREVEYASEQPMAGGALSFEYAMLLIEGMADIRASELDQDAIAMALWDGTADGGVGGTARTVERWRTAGRRVEVIDVDAVRAATAAVVTGAAPRAAGAQPAPAQHDSSTIDTQIVALLFADAKGFSALSESQIPQFVDHFLGSVARLHAPVADRTLLKNTWGDGLYLVFADVGSAGEFALSLCEQTAATNWSEWGLPRHLSFRVGLHAAPVYSRLDPITGRRNFFGSHVSRAARIEPIAPPGRAYATRAFAALARAARVDSFKCDYVGQTPLAKGYATLPMYVLTRQLRTSAAEPARAAK